MFILMSEDFNTSYYCGNAYQVSLNGAHAKEYKTVKGAKIALAKVSNNPRINQKPLAIYRREFVGGNNQYTHIC